MSFKLEDVFELTDAISLSSNKLLPPIKIVDNVITIDLQVSFASVYALDQLRKEILFVLHDEKDPLILLMKEFEGLPPASLKSWAEIDNGVFFDNPEEKDLSKLFGVKYLKSPTGREYTRIIPPIVTSEKTGDPHLSSNVGKATGSELKGSILGEITLYEIQDETPFEAFILMLNLVNQANTENGGLVHMFIGHRIKYSEIEQ